MLSVTLLLQYQSMQITLKQQYKLFYIIELLNLDHLYTLLLIEDNDMSIKKWHTFEHFWELDIPLEQLILLGQMAL